MIKCYFIEVASIRSSQPRSNFKESEIEKLADSILETDALIRPLILQETGDEKYTVIEGHLEYYAAVRAREKNSLKAEEVNAFIIPDKAQRSAIEQVFICNNNPLSVRIDLPIDTTITSIDDLVVDKLVSKISVAIDSQIQPILDRLTKQEKVLELLESKLSAQIQSSVIQQQLESILAQLAEHKLILDMLEPNVSKKVLDFRKWCKQQNMTQLDNSLNLINNLNKEQLVLKMKQLKIASAENLVANIIDKRNAQTDRRFNSWETIFTLGISKLGDATIKKIIENLK